MAQYYVGIDFGGMSAKAGLFDAGSRMIAKDTVKTSKDDAYATTVAKMAQLVKKLCQDNSVPLSSVKRVGLASPGVIDSKEGVVVRWGNYSWEDKPLAKDMKAALGVDVRVVNDANAAAFGESVYGAGKDFKDRNYRLADLLRELNALEGQFRIRFVTSYPTDITDELIDTVVELDKVCEYFHIPMQSGSSEVLKRMNRRYDRETYKKIVEKVRNKVPDVTITSDFIAGFPGETEEQFAETLSAIDEFELDYSNTAAYSPREKTVAARWVDEFIDEDTKTERLARLNEKVRENCLKSNQKYVGRTLEVLIENFENHKGKNVITGRTRNNKIVHIPCDTDRTGEFLNAKITGTKTWYLQGELV